MLVTIMKDIMHFLLRGRTIILRRDHMANVLTGIRILCGIPILFIPAFSELWYLFYLLGGFTDAIDGTVARKMGTASEFGSKFDTVADFVFTLTVAIKINCALSFPEWLIIWIVIIALVKICCHIAGYIKYHKFKTVHSVMNKICGGTAFIIPLFIGGDCAWQAKAVVMIAICMFTSIAAIVEGFAILRR